MNHEYFADGLPDLDGPNQGISFDADTIAQALVNIYQKKYGNGTAPEPTLFEKTKEIFSNAINKGWNAGGSPTTDRNTAFIDALRHNTEVFSAFRTHKMQSDIAAQLLNDKGELKPFSKFLKDVKPYVSHQNRAWLQTEYDTAVLRAHQAADWKQFEDEKDVLPNLEWQPSTSSNPGEDHKPYWFTVLPIEHEFWKKHRPGDRWNCKCRLTNTDKAPTAAPAETFVKDLQPSKGLESNPGTTGEIFSDKHPYFPENCGKCPFNKGVGKLIDLATGRKKDCGDCKKMNEVCKNDLKKDYKAKSKQNINRKIFEKYYADSDYVNVEYDEESGGVKATHRGHAEHRNDNQKYFNGLTGDDLENIFMDLVYKNGHSIIFCDESKKDKQGHVLSALDMFFDGVRMDIKSITSNHNIGYGSALIAKNKQLEKFNKRTDIKEKSDTVCLFFYDPNYYGKKKIQNGIKYLKTEAHDIRLKHIVCVLNVGRGKIKVFKYDI